MESVAMSVLDRMKSIKYREGFKKEVDSAQMPFAQRAQIQDKIAHDTGKQVFKPSFKSSGLKKESDAYQLASPIGYEAEKAIMKKSY